MRPVQLIVFTPQLCGHLLVDFVFRRRKGWGPGICGVDHIPAVKFRVNGSLVHHQSNIPEIRVGNVCLGDGDRGHGKTAQIQRFEQFFLGKIVQGNQVLGFLNGGLHRELALFSGRSIFRGRPPGAGNSAFCAGGFLGRLQQLLGRILVNSPGKDVHVTQAVADDLLPDLLRRQAGATVGSLIHPGKLLHLLRTHLPVDALPHGLGVDFPLGDHVVSSLVPHKLLGGIFRVVRPDKSPVPGNAPTHTCHLAVPRGDRKVSAHKQSEAHAPLLGDFLCGGGGRRVTPGHQVDAVAGAATTDAKGGGGYLFPMSERSCPCICGSALDVPALILSCSAFQFLYRDAGMRTVTPFAAVA